MGVYGYMVFNGTTAAEICTLSLHDALPIYHAVPRRPAARARAVHDARPGRQRHRGRPQDRRPLPLRQVADAARSEVHTSVLQSLHYLVCLLLLEIKD